MTAKKGFRVQFSPDFDDYATGRKSVREVRCVLCQTAPCSCQPCGECGWSVPPGKNCPRGH